VLRKQKQLYIYFLVVIIPNYFGPKFICLFLGVSQMHHYNGLVYVTGLLEMDSLI